MYRYPSMKNATTIKVGDGANYSRTSNFNIMSFNILTRKKDLVSLLSVYEYIKKLHAYVFVVVVHKIAAIKVKEDYDGIAEGYVDCFETINEVISNLHKAINGIDCNLELFLCCDYK